MNINLIYNETAGDGSHSMEGIVKRLKKHGANVQAFNKGSADLSHFLKTTCDLLVIAGGDGTVQEVLKKMIERPVPIAILPLGNANNMAESLNLDDYLGRILLNWKTGKMILLTMGYLEKEDQKDYFFESVGWGLFADTLSNIKREKKQQPGVTKSHSEDKVAFGLENLKDSVDGLQSSHYQVQIDGVDFSGDYVWIEVMNTSYMGPNLYLAPEATTADSYLDVILIKKGEEEKVAKFIKHQKQKSPYTFDLTLKAREVLIKYAGTMHVDDEILACKSKRAARQNWLKIGLYPAKFWLVPSY